MQTIKDIYWKILRQLLLSISYIKVKESLKKNEDKMTLKFNTCLILMKDIEYVVNNSINTWKNVYHLHKPNNFPIDVEDDDDEEDKDGEDDEGSMQFVTIDYEEYKEQEVVKEEMQDDEETNPDKIDAIFISSLPHSPRKLVATSCMETTL